MKIRMQGSSVRFRLNRREVGELSDASRIEAWVPFEGSPLVYSIELSASAAGIAATFDAGRIAVILPESAGRAWAAGEEVALRAMQPSPDGQALEILVEKDFQCLHKGEEGKDPDAYPNPAAVNGG